MDEIARRDAESTARQELAAEAFREAVDGAKAMIRARRIPPWWSYLFPFNLTITRIRHDV
jgi:hypothetical protein